MKRLNEGGGIGFSRRYVFYILGLAVVILGGIGFFAQGAIKNQLVAWALLPNDSATVELYFTEPLSLPTAYTPGKPFIINGTIHNASSDKKQYSYVMTQTGEGARGIVLREGSLGLSPGETKIIKQSVNPADTGERANFILKLKDNPQQINFWSTKN